MTHLISLEANLDEIFKLSCVSAFKQAFVYAYRVPRAILRRRLMIDYDRLYDK